MRFFWALLTVVVGSLPAAPTFRVAYVPPVDLARERQVVLALSDGLVSFDPKTGTAAPGLASTWSVSADGREWRFSLKVAQWSDGKALTAADVASAWKGLPGVDAEALNSKTLRAVFEVPPADPTVFALPPFLLVPDGDGRSTGPFLAQPAVPGQPLVLTKNPRYRDAKLVGIDRLEFSIASSSLEAARLYREGRVDWVPRGGGPGTWPLPGLKDAQVAPGPGTMFLRLNTKKARLGDAPYRQLLAATLDVRALGQGLRGPLLVPVPGKALPAKAAFGPVPEPVLTVVHPQGETYRSVAASVAEQWQRALGVAVQAQELPYARVKALRAAGDFEVILSSWWDADPRASFPGLFRKGSPENDVGWADPLYDAALDRWRSLPPGKARTAAWDEVWARLRAESAIVPLLSYATVNQINPKHWTGWYPNPFDVHPWPGMAPAKAKRP